MATDWFDSFVAEWETLIKATWSDISDTTLLSSDQAGRNKVIDVFLGRLLNTSAQYVTAPFAVWLSGEIAPETKFGVQNIGLGRMPMQVWRVEKRTVRSNSTNQRTLNNKAFALRDAVSAGTPTWWQEIEPGYLDSSPMNAVNQEFNERNMPWICSCVRWSPGLLVGQL